MEVEGSRMEVGGRRKEMEGSRMELEPELSIKFEDFADGGGFGADRFSVREEEGVEGEEEGGEEALDNLQQMYHEHREGSYGLKYTFFHN